MFKRGTALRSNNHIWKKESGTKNTGNTIYQVKYCQVNSSQIFDPN